MLWCRIGSSNYNILYCGHLYDNMLNHRIHVRRKEKQMIIDIDQIVCVTFNVDEEKYEILFKDNESSVYITEKQYDELVGTIEKLKDVGCSLLCL